MMKLTIDGYKNIIKNKYFTWYKSIITNRIKNKPEGYTETHHILPRSLGGTDNKENLIDISAREHYILHLCLTKFIKGKDRYKMLCAVTCMTMKTLKYTNYNSKVYEKIRTERAKELSNWLKFNSSFKNENVHKKCMNTRNKNNSNVFVTNNPMHREECIIKKIVKTSGSNHYLCKRYNYEYSYDGFIWYKIDPALTTKQICELHNWSIATFNYILSGKTPKRGKMANLRIKKYENNENKKT